MAKKVNYRKIYKEHYGIEFSSDYHIHHLDFNRENNEIQNLLLLPKDLHQKYHFFLNSSMYCSTGNPFERVLDVRISGNLAQSTAYTRQMLREFVEVLDECAKWYDYKMFLDHQIYNIHHIELERKKQ